MNLTEKLAQEKLDKNKEYYVLTKDNKIDTLTWLGKYSSAVEWWNVYNVKEVLAPVPSYEEIQSLTYELELAKKNGKHWFDALGERTIQLADANKMIEDLKHFDSKNVCLENEALRLKVESLRELLKECDTAIKSLCGLNEIGYLDVPVYSNILTRINAAIGESEE